jgi:hypothetical protein
VENCGGEPIELTASLNEDAFSLNILFYRAAEWIYVNGVACDIQMKQ